jgi:ribosome-binding ATPase
MFIGNVDEGDLPLVSQGKLPPLAEKVADYAARNNAAFVAISGKVECELVELSEADRQEYLASLGMTQTGLDRMAISGYKLLNLVTYFTSGPKETRAWTVTQGTKAPQAAGVIHTDFERGFIRAEVISYEDYISYGSEVKVKEAGKLRVEGKEYTVLDGDIMHFRFNV